MNIMFFLKPKSELAYIYDYHTLRQAMEIMEYHKYSCVPILNKEGKYVGSITEGDVLWALKKLDIFNIKEAEDISIMKIKRRVDFARHGGKGAFRCMVAHINGIYHLLLQGSVCFLSHL